MAHRDVDVIRARLTAIAGAAAALSKQLEDLHALAFERRVGGETKVSGGSGGDVDTVGDQRARTLWRRLEAELRAAEVAVVALERAAGNLLTEGRAATEPMFGTSLTPAEFRRLQRARTRRLERGEYTPHRVEPQPDLPK